MAVAEINNLVIEKGTYFESTFNLSDPDGSSTSLIGIGMTHYCTIRKHPSSTIYENFGCNVVGATGRITVSLTEEQTSNLEVGRNYFDIVLVLENKKKKVLRGTAIVEESMSV